MKKRNGYTIVELLLVTGAVVTATSAVYFAYNKKIQTDKFINFEKSMVQMVKDVEAVYTSEATTATIANTIIAPVGGARINMNSEYINGVNIIHPYGGTITLSPATVFVANDSIRYSFINVPSDICVKLATSKLASTANIVRVNAVVTMPAYPMTPAAVGLSQVNCNLATTNVIFVDKVVDKKLIDENRYDK